MSQNFVVLLLIAVSFGNAANSTDEDTDNLVKDPPKLNCTFIKRTLFRERMSCITKFMKYQTQKDTTLASEPDNNCTDVDAILQDFLRPTTNYSQCFDSTFINSIRTRLEMWRGLQNNSEVRQGFKDFLNADGLKCIKENGKIIQDKCLKQVLMHEYTNSTTRQLKFSMHKATGLYFGPTSCSKTSDITKCATNILKTSCSANSANVLLSIEKLLGSNCPSANTTSSLLDQAKPTKASSSSGIIIGVLVGIIALLVLGLFATRKFKNCSRARTESYEVSYQAEPKRFNDVELHAK